MTARRFVSAVLLSFLLLPSGCSEDPGEVGRGLLTDQDTLHLETGDIPGTSLSNFLNRINGNSGRALVGLSQDLEARSIMEFTGIPAFGSGVTIDSATIFLKIDYRFKDSTGEFGLTAHNMLHAWTTSFTWDSLAGSYDNANAGTFVTTIAGSDTSVSFHIDTALVRQWSQAGSGSIMLIPSLTTRLVLGFPNTTIAGDVRPLLTISYRNTADTTITFAPRASRAIFVANASLPSPPQVTFVQAGVRYSGLLRFDSLAIPPNVSVLKAYLEVSVDQSSSFFNNFSRDSLIAFLSRKNVYPYDSLVLGSICSPEIVGTRKFYRGDVTNIVQQWISREANNGFVLRAYGDFTTLDRYGVFGPAAAAGFRPKLTVSYTTLP
jgi:hypothetical protein